MKRTKTGATLKVHEIDTFGSVCHLCRQELENEIPNIELVKERLDRVLDCLAAMMPD